MSGRRCRNVPKRRCVRTPTTSYYQNRLFPGCLVASQIYRNEQYSAVPALWGWYSQLIDRSTALNSGWRGGAPRPMVRSGRGGGGGGGGGGGRSVGCLHPLGAGGRDRARFAVGAAQEPGEGVGGRLGWAGVCGGGHQLEPPASASRPARYAVTVGAALPNSHSATSASWPSVIREGACRGRSRRRGWSGGVLSTSLAG